MPRSVDHAPFVGFPASAFEFYEDLEADCSKAFWDAHKSQYEASVRAPMTALMAQLAEEFGAAKIFRPYRDVRYSHDKTPYKTHQGGFVPTATRTGWYAEISAPGFITAGGCYGMEPAGLKRVRERIAGPDGVRLESMIRKLREGGWQLGGETVKTAPRGYSTDHPRIELLRHKSLSMRRGIDDDTAMSPALVDRVAADWRELRPLVDWLTETLR